ncbi:DUF692 domain-containing protein [Vibrio chagasii]|nr:DUF692 domain-containing protein [Vibrio chagasii]
MSWNQTGSHYFNDLLPLPLYRRALDVFCRNVIQVQDGLQRPMLVRIHQATLPSSIQRFRMGVFG